MGRHSEISESVSQNRYQPYGTRSGQPTSNNNLISQTDAMELASRDLAFSKSLNFSIWLEQLKAHNNAGDMVTFDPVENGWVTWHR